jgi:hypothetical protein
MRIELCTMQRADLRVVKGRHGVGFAPENEAEG